MLISTKSLTPAWLYYFYLALLVWLPWPIASQHVWGQAIFAAVTFLLTAIWLSLWLFERTHLPPSFRQAQPILWLLLIWLGYICFQLIPLPSSLVAILSPQTLSVYPHMPDWLPLTLHYQATVMSVLKSLAYCLLFVLTLLLVDSRQRLMILIYVLIFNALAQAMFAGMVVIADLNIGYVKNTDVAHGTFVNRNHLAGYLNMSLAIGIGLLLSQMNTSKRAYSAWRQHFTQFIHLLLSAKIQLRIYLAIMVIALVLTHSRMGNSAFFASLLIAAVLALYLLKKPSKPLILLISSLIIIDLFIVGSWFGVDQVVDRIQHTATEVSPGVHLDQARLNTNRYTFQYWLDYRWFGSGIGSFEAVFPHYRQQALSFYYQHAHNDYLQILAETGIIGFLLLASCVCLSLSKALQAQRQRRDPLMQGMGFASTMGIIAILIHSTVDFNLQITANSALFMIILALAWLAFYLKE